MSKKKSKRVIVIFDEGTTDRISKVIAKSSKRYANVSHYFRLAIESQLKIDEAQQKLNGHS